MSDTPLSPSFTDLDAAVREGSSLRRPKRAKDAGAGDLRKSTT
jgi:hypothetical protein